MDEAAKTDLKKRGRDLNICILDNNYGTVAGVAIGSFLTYRSSKLGKKVSYFTYCYNHKIIQSNINNNFSIDLETICLLFFSWHDI